MKLAKNYLEILRSIQVELFLILLTKNIEELDEELAAMLLEQKNRVLSRDEHIEMFRSRKKEQLDEIDRFRMMISEVDARKGELYGAQKVAL